jgi:hypothetical protein
MLELRSVGLLSWRLHERSECSLRKSEIFVVWRIFDSQQFGSRGLSSRVVNSHAIDDSNDEPSDTVGCTYLKILGRTHLFQ